MYFEPELSYEMDTQDVVKSRQRVARAKVVEKRKTNEAAATPEKGARRSFNGEMWAKEPEEFLTSETKGQFALQEDFIPF